MPQIHDPSRMQWLAVVRSKAGNVWAGVQWAEGTTEAAQMALLDVRKHAQGPDGEVMREFMPPLHSYYVHVLPLAEGDMTWVISGDYGRADIHQKGATFNGREFIGEID